MDRGTPTGERGISKLKNGRFMVRPQILNPKTGKYWDTTRTTKPGEKIAEARKLLADLEAAAGSGPGVTAVRPRFSDYADELLRSRIARGKVASPATKQKIRHVLDTHLYKPWGNMYLDAITRSDVEKWLDSLGELVLAKEYTPETVNTWWREFKKVMSFGAVRFGFADPTTKMSSISTTQHRTYTLEEPNSLTVEELPHWFEVTWQRQRQHFAMIALGFMTGRRPCELRPIRRTAPFADMDWLKGILQIRRSQTYGEPMEVTKQKKDVVLYTKRITLYDVLQAHVANLHGHRAGSPLMFPPLRSYDDDGSGYMSRSALDKPFADIAEHSKIGKHITPRAMRRTYQDLCRAAGVSETVQMSMSGHATMEMAAHYSTVAETEGRQALIRMSDIAGLKQAARLT